MPDTDPNEFTDRENFVLSYYRSVELSGSRGVPFFDITLGLASVACVVMAVMKEEMAFGFIGYMLVLGRLYYLVIDGSRWGRDFRSIFAKYDAKLKAMPAVAKRESGGGTA